MTDREELSQDLFKQYTDQISDYQSNMKALIATKTVRFARRLNTEILTSRKNRAARIRDDRRLTDDHKLRLEQAVWKVDVSLPGLEELRKLINNDGTD